MADAISVGAMPAGMDAYAGYVNGEWPTFGALPGRFPRAHLLSIDVTGARPDANCLDIEHGDASIADVPLWLDQACLRQYRPTLYVSVGRAQQVIDAAGPRRFQVWTAHYTGIAHICGPQCGFGLSTTVSGTQWIDHRDWDESLLVDDFFGPAQTPAPQTGPTGSESFKPSEEKPVFIVDAVDTKTQFLVFDNGKVGQLHSTAIGSGLTGTARVPYITGVQADVDNIARGYTPA